MYDCNDSTQYYKTMITIISYAPSFAEALASVVNYDQKWCFKPEHNLWS